MPGTGRRSLLAMPLALALGLAVLPIAKGSVDASLAAAARTALARAGLDDVDVTSQWAGLRLSGPPDSRAAALAAVDTMPDRAAVARVEYSLPTAAAAVPTTPTPTPSTSAVVGVRVELVVSGTSGQRVLTLSGTLVGQARHAALLAALQAWAPQVPVDDQLVVVPVGRPRPDVARAWPAFLRLAGQAAAGLTIGGRVSFGADGLELSGLASSEAAAAGLTSLVREAAARGIPARSTVIGPVAAARTQLAAVKGLGGVAFTRGAERLTDPSKRSLAVAAKTIKAMPPGVVVEISGYTDDKGDAGFNRRLSQRQAAEVMKFLVSSGVPANRLSAKGFGELRPKASNRTAAGQAANRRIEFVVKEG